MRPLPNSETPGPIQPRRRSCRALVAPYSSVGSAQIAGIVLHGRRRPGNPADFDKLISQMDDMMTHDPNVRVQRACACALAKRVPSCGFSYESLRCILRSSTSHSFSCRTRKQSVSTHATVGCVATGGAEAGRDGQGTRGCRCARQPPGTGIVYGRCVRAVDVKGGIRSYCSWWRGHDDGCGRRAGF